MRCDSFREAVSALLDGEDPAVPSSALDRHQEACGDCRRWRAEAAALARVVRVGPADDVPDLSRAILAAAGVTPGGRRRGREHVLRGALVVVAIVQVVIGLVDFARGAQAGHAMRELGSWDVALAVGFLAVAVRPARAWGMVPLAAAVVAAMGAGSLADVAAGRELQAREVAHVLEVAGLVLVWLLARPPDANPGVPVASGGGLDGDGAGVRRVVRGHPARGSTARAARRVA